MQCFVISDLKNGLKSLHTGFSLEAFLVDLFINKPEQKSEDAYEFYKIDLSGFVD